MKVTQQRFEDRDEPDADGCYSYSYSGVLYRFVFATRTFIARRYDDGVGEASFLGWEGPPKRKAKGKASIFTEIPYRDSEFREAVEFLRKSEGIERLQVLLCEGYVPVDLREIARVK